jgi:hypothetical protein
MPEEMEQAPRGRAADRGEVGGGSLDAGGSLRGPVGTCLCRNAGIANARAGSCVQRKCEVRDAMTGNRRFSNGGRYDGRLASVC